MKGFYNLFIVLFLFYSNQICFSQTYVGGVINSDQNWYKSESPYILNTRVVVSNNSTLTIEAGTTVIFKSNTQIYVNDGSLLIANGSLNDTIIFKPDTIGSSIYLDFLSSSVIYHYDDLILKFCRFENFRLLNHSYSGRYPSVIFSWGEIALNNCSFLNNYSDEYLIVGATSVTHSIFINNEVSYSLVSSDSIDGCEFSENYCGALIIGGEYFWVTNNTFDNNRCNILIEQLRAYDGNIATNVFSNNQFIDFHYLSFDSVMIRTTVKGTHNNLSNNSFRYLLANASDDENNTIDWTNNYWGKTSTEEIEELIWINPIQMQSFVIYEPFLLSPLTDIIVPFVTKYFYLHQNYPNPFNPTTKIKYLVPKNSFVTLKVFDLLGREVATLVNEEKAIGSYEVNFNADNLSSGIYLYQLKAENYKQTKKMVLLR